MKFTRFIFRPRWQSMWIRALSEVAEQGKSNPQPKAAEPTSQRGRVTQVHCVENA